MSPHKRRDNVSLQPAKQACGLVQMSKASLSFGPTVSWSPSRAFLYKTIRLGLLLLNCSVKSAVPSLAISHPSEGNRLLSGLPSPLTLWLHRPLVAPWAPKFIPASSKTPCLDLQRSIVTSPIMDSLPLTFGPLLPLKVSCCPKRAFSLAAPHACTCLPQRVWKVASLLSDRFQIPA